MVQNTFKETNVIIPPTFRIQVSSMLALKAGGLEMAVAALMTHPQSQEFA